MSNDFPTLPYDPIFGLAMRHGVVNSGDSLLNQSAKAIKVAWIFASIANILVGTYIARLPDIIPNRKFIILVSAIFSGIGYLSLS